MAGGGLTEVESSGPLASCNCAARSRPASPAFSSPRTHVLPAQEKDVQYTRMRNPKRSAAT
jgi:hypothetical protein